MKKSQLLTPRLVSSVTLLLENAGREIMNVYTREDFGTRIKDDDSPVTAADIASDEVIKKGLNDITPGINVFSEETKDVDYTIRSGWDPLWILDPLDGTKEFISKSDEFCISLALVYGNRIAAGFIHAPVTKESWIAIKGQGAWKLSGGKKKMLPLTVTAGPYHVNISRTHHTDREALYIEELKKHHEIVIDIHGSAIKFCRIAEGISDIYPKFSTIHEWDIAAGHLLIEECGGVIIEILNLEPPLYNKQDYFQAPFIAFGHRIKNWKKLIYPVSFG